MSDWLIRLEMISPTFLPCPDANTPAFGIANSPDGTMFTSPIAKMFSIEVSRVFELTGTHGFPFEIPESTTTSGIL